RKARRARPDARLLVTGCAADIEREQIAAMPEVDGLIANGRKLDARSWNVSSVARPVTPTHPRAFVAVQNGCDHECNFCVIPQGRGASRSLTVPAVLREIERHLAPGARAVLLTALDQSCGGHVLADRPSVVMLVQAILNTFPLLGRVRRSSLDGIESDEPLFE